MAKQGITLLCLVLALLIMNLDMIFARKSHNTMNVIDKCWRKDPDWSSNRFQLAKCSIGYAGKMTGVIGEDVTNYTVTDPKDNPTNPKPGTLRYGASKIKGKVWITFAKSMVIKLKKPLYVKSYTVIDGRGANVHIAFGAGLVLEEVTHVIIHGLHIHNCKPKGSGKVVGKDGEVMKIGKADGDAIRILASSKIWVDHNKLFHTQDGLVDVTRGSTNVTISNNWFLHQNKVMLFGHDDSFATDKNMKATFAFNRFGPHCNQRMPRIRFGYAHVVNNIYLGWGIYAIGGTMNPSVKSQANLFIAPTIGPKEITWANNGKSKSNFNSVDDVFLNGAHFKQTDDKGEAMKPNYGPDQKFHVEEDGRKVKALTRSAGALKCRTDRKC